MMHMTDLSSDVITPPHQLSEIIKSVTPLSLAGSLPASTRAGTQPPRLAALASFRLILPPETQQPLANLHQHLHRALAPLAHVGAGWQQIMDPLVHMGQQVAQLFQPIRAPILPISVDRNRLLPFTSPVPIELRKALQRRAQADQARRHQFLADMQAHPEYYRSLRDQMDLLHVRFGSTDWLTAEAYEAAIYRLASCVPPKLVDPRARRALNQMAGETGERPADILRKRIFPEAVLLVMHAVSIPQRIQLGRQRLKDHTGRWLSTPPVHLLPYEFERFFRQHIRNAAEAILLDEPYPPPQRNHDLLVERAAPKAKEVIATTTKGKGSADEDRQVSYEQAELEHYKRYGRDPFLFPTPERSLEIKSLLTTLNAASTSQQKTYLLKVADGASRQEIQAEMRISPGNSRQILRRIRENARRLS